MNTAVGTDLYNFWRARSAWSAATFGAMNVRGPIGPLRHLEKEVKEALAKPEDLEEYADLLFLVFDATERAGFSYHDLVLACWRKLEKNRARKWSTLTDDAPVEHIREEDPDRDDSEDPEDFNDD